MKTLLLCFFIAAALCQIRTFRYKNGTYKSGRENIVAISGSFYMAIFNLFGRQIQGVLFVGMDFATMTPFMITGESNNTTFDTRFNYTRGEWGNKRKHRLRGNITLHKSETGFELVGEFVKHSGVFCLFKASLVETCGWFYPPKEAGSRAKYLIGQNSEDFGPAAVALFAISDLAVYMFECRQVFREHWPEIPGPEPGAVVVGRDRKHCGIVDDEGTKLVHSNPVVKKVTYESLAVIRRYFPNGVVYKRYPRESSLDFFESYIREWKAKFNNF